MNKFLPVMYPMQITVVCSPV